MARVGFLVDGFNLYHSLRQVGAGAAPAGARWPDLRALCDSYLPAIGRDDRLVRVSYFSALAHFREAGHPGSLKRQAAYLAALRATGVAVHLGRFKRRRLRCPHCASPWDRQEEKETDVAIAVTLLEDFAGDVYDTAVLVTGDTDLAPSVRAARRLYPHREVSFLFPVGRKNKELSALVRRSFTIGPGRYERHQLPSPVIGEFGRRIAKPAAW